MSELDALIGAGLRQLADARTPTSDAPDVMAVVRTRVARRHRRRVAAFVATPLVVLGVAAWAAWPAGNEHTAVVTEPDPTTTTVVEGGAPTDDDGVEDAARAGVTELDPGPLSPRRSPAAVDLGDGRIFVWGGEDAGNYLEGLVDGATYDIATGEWTLVEPAPLDPDPRRRNVAILADRDVVVFSDTSVASWNIDSGEWRDDGVELPLPVHDAVWTGEEIVAFSPRANNDDDNDMWTAVDPAMATTRPLPGTTHPVQQIGWVGGEVITLGRIDCCGSYRGDVHRSVHAEAMAFDPVTSSWRELPPGSISPGWFSGAQHGDSIVVVDDSGWSAAFDASTGEWREMPAVPLASTREGAQVVGTDRGPVALLGRSISILEDDRTWRSMPLSPGVDELLAEPVGIDGGRIARFGSLNDGSTDPVNRFQLIDLDDLRASGQVYLGVTFALPRDAELTSATRTDPNRPSGVVSAVVRLGSDECTIEVRLGQSLSSTTAGTVTIEPADGRPRWEASRLDGSTGTALGRGSHRIDCGTLERSVELASYIHPPEHWYDG